jgi:hypothetical protein
MTDILKGGKNDHVSGPFLPTLVMKRSFTELCNAFTKAFMQAHSDSAKPIHLETNASGFAIAGIIM